MDALNKTLLSDLCDQLTQAKKAEDDARLARVQIEVAIQDIVGAKAEGSTTMRIPGWRIETIGNQSRRIDAKALQAVLPQLPDDQKAVQFKPTLNLLEYRRLAIDYPEQRALLDRAIVTNQNKTRVLARRIETEE